MKYQDKIENYAKGCYYGDGLRALYELIESIDDKRVQVILDGYKGKSETLWISDSVKFQAPSLSEIKELVKSFRETTNTSIRFEWTLITYI